MVDDYILGLEVSNGKIGYAGINDNNDLIKIPVNRSIGISKSKLAVGFRNFEPGHSAKERRGHRISGRATSRRKMRIRNFKEIFEPEIVKETGDKDFFKRMGESWMSPDDDRKTFKTAAIVKKTEPTYHYFPTAYHMRKWLVETDEKADLRYVCAACQHIIKHPGNFLSKLPPSSYENVHLDVKGDLEAVNDLLQELDSKTRFDVDYTDNVDAVLKAKNLSNKERSKQLFELLYVKSSKKEQAKKDKKKTEELSKAMLGMKFKLNVFLDKNVLDTKAWSITLEDEDIDEKLEDLRTELSDEESKILDHVCNIFNAVKLSEIVMDGMTISQSVVKNYDEYGHQLNLFRKYAKQQDKDTCRLLFDAYDMYCANPKYMNRALKIRAKKEKAGSIALDAIRGPKAHETFSNVVKNVIGEDKSELAQKLSKLIENNNLLVKTHSTENRVVLYQVNEVELNKILEKQGKYYPFLVKKNPVVGDKKFNKKWVRRHPYELDQLLAFRIPYFVGPMITPEEQAKTSENVYAWMVRAEEGKITPWNWRQKVDVEKTAEAFIQRMVKTDSSLLEEKVLPDNSLLYQEYKVLNELNGIKVNDKKLNSYQKELAMNLFKKYKSVSKKKFVKELQKKGSFGKPMVVTEISGLSDPDKFSNSLSTYNDFKKIFGEKINDPKLQNDFENIVYWISLFDDDDILMHKFESIDWLTDKNKTKLLGLSYKGWGRYSKRTLTELVDDNNKSVIEKMREKSLMINQCLSDPSVKRQLDEHNQKVAKSAGLEEILNAAYASPSVKKIVRQAVKVTQDLVISNGGKAPRYISIRSSRSADEEKELTKSRQSKLKGIINKYKNKSGYSDLIDKKLLEEFSKATKNKRVLTDKEYIFFLQLGRDFFTGERIAYSQLKDCIISHAVATSLCHDESMSNRVLILAKNAKKVSDRESRMKQFSNNHLADAGMMSVYSYWLKLQSMGLINKSKMYFLKLDESNITENKKLSYVRHAFMENAQATKILALVFQSMYPDTEVIQVRSEFVNDVRKAFSIYRSYAVNDYYVGVDAYLDALLGNYFLKVYPKLAPFFIYGKHMYAEDSKKSKELAGMKRMNLIWRLTNGYKDDDGVYQSGTNNVVFSRKEIIEKIRKVDNLKYMNVSYETVTDLSSLFNATIYPNPSNDSTKGGRSLIKRKKYMPTELYGGYSSLTTAMIGIIRRYNSRKKCYVNNYVSIPALAIVNVAQKRKENPKAFQAAVRKYLSQTIDGDFTILNYGINLQTRVQEGGKDYYLRAIKRAFDARQLILSQKSRKVIADCIEDRNYSTHKYVASSLSLDEELNDVFEEIVEQLKTGFELWNTGDYKAKVAASQQDFEDLEIADKVSTLRILLRNAKSNASFSRLDALKKTNIPAFGPSTNIGDDVTLIYTSPTGLRISAKKVLPDK